MRREEYIQILDGTHPDHGRGWAYAHQGLIVASGLAISLETVEGLPVWAHKVLIGFEALVIAVFVVEYVARIVCARKPLRYIFSFWGIIDFLSCLPALLIVQSQWAALRSFRLLRLIRLLKLLHANRALHRLETALAKSRGELLVFAFLALIVLYIAGVGIFIFEHDAQPEVFTSIPRSLWWAVVSFTTVGYGDMYPITPQGRLFTSGILFIGLGVIAVPTAIITTALLNTEISEKIEREVEEELGEGLEEIEREVRKDLAPLKRKPTRRQ
ncbi:ion transporter [Tropicimonas isoalkanivorans]|uniref:Voltage-gated potassium channel n=1 Tax=Tropicimonas isoalkanivorans TaxID=441112 RepID=A0A1I1NGS5_9RHOB|nr:ion transporter [Tropicimonas isoalkanivorans]SFC96821.1 voltage-gated potassium channel [Tropicimonas isoalkanivorans]